MKFQKLQVTYAVAAPIELVEVWAFWSSNCASMSIWRPTFLHHRKGFLKWLDFAVWWFIRWFLWALCCQLQVATKKANDEYIHSLKTRQGKVHPWCAKRSMDAVNPKITPVPIVRLHWFWGRPPQKQQQLQHVPWIPLRKERDQHSALPICWRGKPETISAQAHWATPI